VRIPGTLQQIHRFPIKLGCNKSADERASPVPPFGHVNEDDGAPDGVARLELSVDGADLSSAPPDDTAATLVTPRRRPPRRPRIRGRTQENAGNLPASPSEHPSEIMPKQATYLEKWSRSKRSRVAHCGRLLTAIAMVPSGSTRRRGRGLPSSYASFPDIPLPLRLRDLKQCTAGSACRPWHSPSAARLGSLLTLSDLYDDDAAGFELCCGQSDCS